MKLCCMDEICALQVIVARPPPNLGKSCTYCYIVTLKINPFLQKYA